MSDIDALSRLIGRIDAGEPIRIIVGAVTHRATEIIPSPDFAGRIRRDIRADAAREIEQLSTPAEGENIRTED